MHMKAQLVVRAKEVWEDGAIVEIVVWRLPEAVPPCEHPFKYRLFFGGAGGASRVRYDNERGKGDHRHVGHGEQPYAFISLDRLLADFRRDVEHWRSKP